MHPNVVLSVPLVLLALSGLCWQGGEAQSTNATNATATKAHYYALYDYLFADATYKKEIRPAESLDDPLVVSMEFSLLSILGVDEKQQMLSTSARLEFYWDDDYLSWDSTEYGDIDNILVPQKKLYLPDIVLANSVSAQKPLGYDGLPVRLTDIGIVDWEPTVQLNTDCDIDITYFPFETQKCFIDFETAVSSNTEIDIDVYQGTSAMHLYDYSVNGQWDLVETKAENLGDENFKTKIRFTVLIKRRRTFYVMNIILPVFFLSLTASLVFAIPADEGEKMGTGITVLLAFAVYLTIVSDLVPNTSLQVSILGLYLTILLGVSALSVIVCVFVLRLHHKDEEESVGKCTQGFIRFLRILMCLGNGSDKSSSKNSPNSNRVDPSIQHSRPYVEDGRRSGSGRESYSADSHHSKRHPSSPPSRPVMYTGDVGATADTDSAEPMTWKTVAHTLDWFFFVFFTLATILITLIMLLYLHFGSIADAPSL